MDFRVISGCRRTINFFRSVEKIYYLRIAMLSRGNAQIIRGNSKKTRTKNIRTIVSVCRVCLKRIVPDLQLSFKSLEITYTFLADFLGTYF